MLEVVDQASLPFRIIVERPNFASPLPGERRTDAQPLPTLNGKIHQVLNRSQPGMSKADRNSAVIPLDATHDSRPVAVMVFRSPE